MTNILVGILALLVFLLIVCDPMFLYSQERMNAELYCRYRLFKSENGDESIVFFKAELFFIIEGLRKDIQKRCSKYSALWLALPEEEKNLFLEHLNNEK